MQLPQIRIQSIHAKLNLDIQKPNQEISQIPADLQIEQPMAEMNIELTPSRLTIDQTLAWENLDLKGPLKRMDEAAQLGMQASMEAIGEIASKGNELMKIENKGNPIITQVIQLDEEMFPLDIGSTPSQFSVKVQYDPGDLKIDWKVNKPLINVNINKPTHDYNPGMVSGFVDPYASLQIDFVGINIDKAL